MKILVINRYTDLIIGQYESDIIPKISELLNADDGTWLVRQVQHNIPGTLQGSTERTQNSVNVYVNKLKDIPDA